MMKRYRSDSASGGLHASLPKDMQLHALSFLSAGTLVRLRKVSRGVASLVSAVPVERLTLRSHCSAARRMMGAELADRHLMRFRNIKLGLPCRADPHRERLLEAILRVLARSAATLTHLLLEGATPPGELLDAACACRGLRSLWWMGNTALPADALRRLLVSLPSLDELHLGGGGAQGVDLLLEADPELPPLRCLSLGSSRAPSGNPAVAGLLRLLRVAHVGTHLEKLSLHINLSESPLAAAEADAVALLSALSSPRLPVLAVLILALTLTPTSTSTSTPTLHGGDQSGCVASPTATFRALTALTITGPPGLCGVLFEGISAPQLRSIQVSAMRSSLCDILGRFPHLTGLHALHEAPSIPAGTAGTNALPPLPPPPRLATSLAVLAVYDIREGLPFFERLAKLGIPSLQQLHLHQSGGDPAPAPATPAVVRRLLEGLPQLTRLSLTAEAEAEAEDPEVPVGLGAPAARVPPLVHAELRRVSLTRTAHLLREISLPGLQKLAATHCGAHSLLPILEQSAASLKAVSVNNCTQSAPSADSCGAPPLPALESLILSGRNVRWLLSASFPCLRTLRLECLVHSVDLTACLLSCRDTLRQLTILGRSSVSVQLPPGDRLQLLALEEATLLRSDCSSLLAALSAAPRLTYLRLDGVPGDVDLVPLLTSCRSALRTFCTTRCPGVFCSGGSGSVSSSGSVSDRHVQALLDRRTLLRCFVSGCPRLIEGKKRFMIRE